MTGANDNDPRAHVLGARESYRRRRREQLAGGIAMIAKMRCHRLATMRPTASYAEICFEVGRDLGMLPALVSVAWSGVSVSARVPA